MHKLKWLIFCALPAAFNVDAGYRDPTLPGNLPAAQASSVPQQNPDLALDLTAILISDSGRHAIINGVTVKTGQQFNNDTRILSIQPRYVLIRQRNVNKKLYLVPSLKTR
ncbi:hypothetical protein A1359_15190 [Methylomonas lenta]|uniref:MSHA biogenesis protein MshK n=1 Tax=Methylomonas lenta TaxID=980561 RepID=A0A177N1F0_9GAMM|nr:hypothetical protein [Methylomonas lenta]OAI11040.1 hypothetical protein A1359_15190 [Methylomonas lenta]